MRGSDLIGVYNFSNGSLRVVYLKGKKGRGDKIIRIKLETRKKRERES